MKRAAGPIIALCRLRFALVPRNFAANHVGYGHPGPNFIEKVVRKAHIRGVSCAIVWRIVFDIDQKSNRLFSTGYP